MLTKPFDPYIFITMASYFNIPTAVYRLYDVQGTLLYVGASTDPVGTRLQNHTSVQPWRYLIRRVDLAWYPTALDARRAEAAVILAEQPLYNTLRMDPDKVFEDKLKSPRGNGMLCPKCGAEKSQRKKAYCDKCLREYQQTRRLVAAAKVE